MWDSETRNIWLCNRMLQYIIIFSSAVVEPRDISRASVRQVLALVLRIGHFWRTLVKVGAHNEPKGGLSASGDHMLFLPCQYSVLNGRMETPNTPYQNDVKDSTTLFTLLGFIGTSLWALSGKGCDDKQCILQRDPAWQAEANMLE
jgi:hypothetical protein